MNARTWFVRGLAVGHLAWGLLLVLLALYVTWTAFSVLAYMSTGTVWTNLPTAILLGVQQAAPFAALGAWMLILGLRLWTGRSMRRALLVTHGILLVPGMIAIGIGVVALRAAAASAAHGGGLLGGWGVIPLGIGTFVLALAVPSILAAVLLPAPDRTGARL